MKIIYDVQMQMIYDILTKTHMTEKIKQLYELAKTLRRQMRSNTRIISAANTYTQKEKIRYTSKRAVDLNRIGSPRSFFLV